MPAAVRALAEASIALVRRSSSGPVGLAKLAGVVDSATMPPYLRPGVEAELSAALAATSEPLPLKRIERSLKDAWGQAPGKVLDSLETAPLAVTPSAQVHRAVLDGAAVAVKVRRPGLASAVRGDFALLDALAPAVSLVFGSVDAGALLREARERVLDELDLEHSGATQRQFARGLRRVDGIAAPEVNLELTAPEVLVSEFFDGPTLASGATPADPGALARALVLVHVGASRSLALVPADARADHVVLREDGTIGLLGLGAARRVDRARVDAGLEALAVLRSGSADAFGRALVRLKLLPAEAGPEAFAVVDDFVGEVVRGPFLLDADALATLADRAIAGLADALPVAERVTPSPADLWPLRMFVSLAALLGRIGATEDWGELALEAGREGWPGA